MSDYSMCFACHQVESGTPGRCPACGRSAMRPLAQTTGLTLEQVRAFTRSVSSSGDRNASLKRRWIVTFAMCMKSLRDESAVVTEVDVALFWIRLWGIVVEMPANFAGAEAMFGGLTGEEVEKLPPTSRIVARWYRRALPAVQGIRSQLTDDMLLYLEWRRHIECHTKQSAFMVQLNGKPGAWKSAKMSARIATLGREVTVEAAWVALQRVSTQYGDDDDHAVARAFSEAIDEPAWELVDAWREYHPW